MTEKFIPKSLSSF